MGRHAIDRTDCNHLCSAGYKTEILAASIRNPNHIIRAAELGADVITSPLESILGLLKHPLTDIGLAKFVEDAKKFA
jgi:transaldolase